MVEEVEFHGSMQYGETLSPSSPCSSRKSPTYNVANPLNRHVERPVGADREEFAMAVLSLVARN